jgi:GntR family negative regulator for fad regulon and positive regulator of fabA
MASLGAPPAMASPATAPATTGLGGSPASEAVLEALLVDIMRGTYPAGARLPAERELARTLGASRPTLREALRRLGAWQLVEPRRGSGVVVRPVADWSIEVLPAYLRHGRPVDGAPGLRRIVADLLALRRTLLVDVIRLVAGRIPAGGTATARAQVARAAAMRGSPADFVREDFKVMRLVVEAAGLLPAVWMLNRMTAVYGEVAELVAGFVRVPDDYEATTGRYLDCVERGDGDGAAAVLGEYLERHDRVVTRALGAAS